MIKAVIFDLDGTIYLGNKLIGNIKTTLKILKERKIPYIFVTNTTSKSTQIILKKLNNLGIEIEENKIISPVVVSKQFLRRQNVKKIAIEHCPPLEPEYNEFEISLKPDVVILADDGKGLEYEAVNRIFNHHLNGAKITSLQKNKYYRKEGELVADLGFYVAGFEYITGNPIMNFGKPSQELFEYAQSILQVADKNNIAVVGDDLEFDILGAQKLGFKGFLVQTGKYQNGIEDNFSLKPDHVIQDAADIISFI